MATDQLALLDDALLASRAGVRQLDQELIEIAPLVETEVADRRQAGAVADLRLSELARGALVWATGWRCGASSRIWSIMP